MFVDKDYGLVSSKTELNMLRRIDKHMKQVDEVVLCGDTIHAQLRCKHDYKAKPHRNAKKYVDKIVYNNGNIKRTVHYISISSGLDGWRFKNISVDSSAVKLRHYDQLVKTLNILMSAQVGVY